MSFVCSLHSAPSPALANWVLKEIPWLTTTNSIVNPFSRRESHTSGAILTYKILTLVTWLLSVIVSVYYTINEPRDGYSIRRRIWDQNDLYRTAFTLNATITSIYWYVLDLAAPSDTS